MPRNAGGVRQVACKGCVHQRRGTSVTDVAFQSVLKALQPRVTQTKTQLRQAERDRSGQFLDEQQGLEQSGDAEMTFSSRPTDLRVAYCGFAEFEGRYYCCEVKNSPKNIVKESDKSCNDFSPKPEQPVVHSCDTCRHLHRVPPTLIRDLEKVAGRRPEGRQSMMELQQTLQYQATSEFEECVDKVGILQSPPGFLPLCEARSLSNADESEPRYVVGPVLNASRECNLWEPGDNERAVQKTKEFDQLMADMKRAVQYGTEPPKTSGYVDPLGDATDLNPFQRLAANAEADVLEYGLAWLNVDSHFTENLCSELMRQVWFVTERTDRANLQRMVNSIPSLQLNVPFPVENGKTYRHPNKPGLTLYFDPLPPAAVVQGEKYYLQNFPLNTWKQLLAPSGERLLIGLQVAGPGGGVMGLVGQLLLGGGGMSLMAQWLPDEAQQQELAKKQILAKLEEIKAQAKQLNAQAEPPPAQPTASNFYMATGEEGVDETELFAPTDSFFVHFDVAGIKVDTPFQARWYALDSEDPDTPFRTEDRTCEEGEENFHFGISNSDNWPVGDYKVEIYMNGKKVGEEEFLVLEVETDRPSAQPTVSNFFMATDEEGVNRTTVFSSNDAVDGFFVHFDVDGIEVGTPFQARWYALDSEGEDPDTPLMTEDYMYEAGTEKIHFVLTNGNGAPFGNFKVEIDMNGTKVGEQLFHVQYRMYMTVGGRSSNRTTAFLSTDVFFVHFAVPVNLFDIKAGTRFQARWYALDSEGYDSDTPVYTEDYTSDEDAEDEVDLQFTLQYSDGAPTGNHKVEIYMNGTKLGEKPFRVLKAKEEQPNFSDSDYWMAIDEEGANRTTVFSPTDDFFLHIVPDIEGGIEAGTAFQVRWYALYSNDPNTPVRTEDYTYEEGIEYFHFSLKYDGAPFGNYKAEIYMNGTKVGQKPFRVSKVKADRLRSLQNNGQEERSPVQLSAEEYFTRGLNKSTADEAYEEAIADYDQAIRLNPHYAEAYFRRGVDYANLGDLKRAIEDYDQAIQLNPQYAEAHFEQGVAYQRQDDTRRAIEAFDQVIRIKPRDAEAYIKRGYAYENLGDYKRAIEDYDQVIQLKPQDAEAYTFRASAYEELGDTKHAIEDYDQAIRINPQEESGYQFRGIAYEKLGDYKRAIEDYDQFIRIRPEVTYAYYQRGGAYEKLGDTKRAIEDYDQAIRIDPKYTRVYYDRGLAYESLGDTKRAIEDYDQAIRLNPQYAEAHEKRNLAYEKLGDTVLAQADFDRANRIRSDMNDTHRGDQLFSALESQAKGPQEQESNVLTIDSPFHLELIRVPAGEFLMGSDPAKDEASQPDEQPQHRVYVSEFYIGKYPITNAQFAAFAKAMQRQVDIPPGKENHPVDEVSWHHTVAFCQWLSKATGKSFRMPTEAEWEKAARGTDGRIYPWGNEWDRTKANTSEGGRGGTTPVGQYSPAGDSPYGAADMSGNMWEWCADWYDEGEYQRRSGAAHVVKDPQGPDKAQYRVLRGGMFMAPNLVCRAAGLRGGREPREAHHVGFRLALSPVPSIVEFLVPEC
jgi:formylglycine-generating enzyme required for sulfatase activity/Flp pilus assembly protein TadD